MRLTVLLLSLLLSCEGPPSPPSSPSTVELAFPTYTEHIQPLLEHYCVDCHQHGGVMYAGVELDTYAAARSVRVRNTCTAISDTLIDEFAPYLVPQDGHSDEAACAPWEPLSMPPGTMMRLSPDQQRMLAIWVASGAPE